MPFSLGLVFIAPDPVRSLRAKRSNPFTVRRVDCFIAHAPRDDEAGFSATMSETKQSRILRRLDCFDASASQ
jgi:hypothetical protein